MKSDNAIRNGTSIFVGIIVAIAAFVRGALLLPLLLVACSVWGLYVLQGSTSVLPELHGFPPVGCWEKLKQVFAGDGLAAEETSGKLVLSW